MSAPALVPSPLYGMRTWSVVGERGHERLAGPQRASPWPTAGAWLEASCEHGDRHAAPAPGCECGIHAWHPERRAAKRVLATRGQVAGVVEASGAIEVHRDGLRAERARPYALVLAPRTNAGLIDRLASAYDVEVVPANGPDAIVAWCRARGLGLERSVVDGLLGPERVAQQRRQARVMRLRIVAAVVAIAVLLGVGLVATADPGDRTLQGRAGEVRPR